MDKHDTKNMVYDQVGKKNQAVKTEALKKKEVSFSNQRCKHGVTNANYCESCSHPKRAKLNEGRIPFRDKMSKRED
jgi:hypothetical protein